MGQQFYSYLHTRPDGTPFYVGKGFGRRSHNLVGRNAHHKSIVAKYGAQAIGIFVFEFGSEEEAICDEVLQIALLRRENCALANYTDGGDGLAGYRHSKESKRRQSDMKRGRALSSEWRRSISRGIKNSAAFEAALPKMVNFGPRSEEAKSRMRGVKHADSFEANVTDAAKALIVADYCGGLGFTALQAKYKTCHHQLRPILVDAGVRLRLRGSRLMPHVY